MKRPLLFLLATPFIAGIAVAACGSSDDCNETKTCPGTVPGEGGVDGDGGTDGPVIVAPKDCDLTKEPKDSPACVDDMVGIFVDAQSGVDSGPGTKMSPVKTIKAALEKAGQKRIYICEGTYKEHVKLTGPNSMYGGFACMKWEHTGTKAKIAPDDKGYALHAEKLSSPIVISDLDFSAVDATEPGESSIAMFFSEVSKASLIRAAASAGKGVAAGNESDPPSNLFSETPADHDGKSNEGAAGGGQKVCACKSYGSSTGGKGGNAGNPQAPNGEPGNASPVAPVESPKTSAGGNGYPNGLAGICEAGKHGSNGKPRLGGKASASAGSVDANGWRTGAGSNGEAGNPGNGGGGGGGDIGGGSGGGACGGCGGAGGLGGKGGGSSIALLAFNTALVTTEVTLVSSAAGKGGGASKGGAGSGGGTGGTGTGTCSGGRGGNGAGGGGGAGGNGGVSAGIVRKGGILEGTPRVTLGARGEPGSGADPGAPGSNVLGAADPAVPGEPGREGLSKDVVEIQ